MWLVHEVKTQKQGKRKERKKALSSLKRENNGILLSVSYHRQPMMELFDWCSLINPLDYGEEDIYTAHVVQDQHCTN